MNEDLDIKSFRQMLLAIKEELVATENVRDEASSVVELDQTRMGRLSRMDAMQGQAMAIAMRKRAEERLRQISAALRRIDEGNYGYCVRCEEPIDLRRLQFDPATPFCINCVK